MTHQHDVAAIAALADRVEAATGPDRELDDLIYRMLAIEPRRGDPGYPAYAYTASLDAAMLLVDEEHESAVMWNRDDRKAYAAVGPNALSGFPLGEGKSRGLEPVDTKARAITAAALKALGASHER